MRANENYLIKPAKDYAYVFVSLFSIILIFIYASRFVEEMQMYWIAKSFSCFSHASLVLCLHAVIKKRTIFA